MTKLNDLQSLLLSNAAQRDEGSLLPVPDSVAGAGTRLTKALAALVKNGLAEERESADPAAAYRIEGDQSYGLYINAAGSAAIGIGGPDTVAPGADVTGTDAAPGAVTAPKVARITKTAAVLLLLRREEGATLAELIEATGWLPHTTRAALTGLRKKGHAVERGKRGDATCYHVATVADEAAA